MAVSELYAKGPDGNPIDPMRRSKKGQRQTKQIESPDKKLISQYRREIERYNRSTSSWREDGNNIERLYLDEDRSGNSDSATATRRFALLWSNVETLKPAVYAKLPVVECSRRFKDRDPVGRTAAELMERATNSTFDLYNVDETFRMVRDDRLLSGRGTGWVRYEATIEQYEDEDAEGADDASELGGPEGNEPAETEAEAMRERLAGEKVCVDYVQWTEFGHNVCGAWNDVWLVWRWVYKTREEVADRFGQEVADKLTYDAVVPANLADRVNGFATGEDADEFCKIAELWDKRRNLTSWMTDGLRDRFLESDKPPINFSNFFPCPQPCYATKTSRSLIPRPDYVYYRDQAKEINDLTDKIANMMEWLIVKAFVPGAPSRVADPIEEIIREKSNKELFVQVDSMAEWTEGGGVKGLIDWLPLDTIIQAIQSAISARNQLIQDVFQITGISDILRGQTDPNETLGAQELKAQTGSRRLRNAKDELARFCRDIGRMTAEVIAEKFQPETIAAMTGYRYQPPAPPPVALGGNVISIPGMPAPAAAPAMPAQPAVDPLAPQNGPSMVFDDRVIDLLRNDRLRSFRIDIETDSTGQADEQAEKQQAMEFIEATSGFMDKAVAAITQQPEVAELMGEMLMFTVRKFRAGRSLEESIEKTFMGIAQKAQQAAQGPQQPSAEEQKTQADIAIKQQQAAQAAEAHQQDMADKAAKTQAALSTEAEKQRKLQAEQVFDYQEHIAKMQKLSGEMMLSAAKPIMPNGQVAPNA